MNKNRKIAYLITCVGENTEQAIAVLNHSLNIMAQRADTSTDNGEEPTFPKKFPQNGDYY